MTIYSTYQEAKIANPEYAIFEYQGRFGTDKDIIDSFDIHSVAMSECNPADHCMTVEKFLANGYKFVEGDFALGHSSSVTLVCDDLDWNIEDRRDNKRYILRAAALETKEPKRTKVDYVKIDMPISDIAKAMIDGEVFYSGSGSEVFLWDGYKFVNSLDDSRSIPVVGVYYRRIETEIAERDEFIDRAYKAARMSTPSVAVDLMGELYDAGCRFVGEEDK